jgi:broad specificity phosphatase PhoE
MDILMVRHGQASAGSAHYDQLSAMGYQQADVFARWLIERDARHKLAAFDAIYSGNLTRHRQTREPIIALLELSSAASQTPLPPVRELPELNEFDHRDVMQCYGKQNASSDLVQEFLASPAHPRLLARYLHASMSDWIAGKLDQGLKESFVEFQTRVRRGIENITAQHRDGERILIVSSGGVMSQWAQTALACPNIQAIELNMSIRNTAIAEFRLRERGLSLITWNSLPHLSAPEFEKHQTFY